MVKKIALAIIKAGPPPRVREALGLTLLEACLDSVPRLVFFSTFHEVLIKALLLTLYYGCLRVGELALSSNPNHVLLYKNTEFVTIQGKKYFKFTLDSFKHGKAPASRMFAENPNSRYCPVKCLAGYLNMRPKMGKWFFLTGEESPVTRVFVASALDRLSKFAGLDPESFGTHSIRAGRASDMAAA